jgi:hypothetical protein
LVDVLPALIAGLNREYSVPQTVHWKCQAATPEESRAPQTSQVLIRHSPQAGRNATPEIERPQNRIDFDAFRRSPANSNAA